MSALGPVRVCQVMGDMDGGAAQEAVMGWYRAIDRSRVQFDFVASNWSADLPTGEIGALGGEVYIVPRADRPRELARCCRDLFLEHPEWGVAHAHAGAQSAIPLREAERAGVHVRVLGAHAGDGDLLGPAQRLLWREACRHANARMACDAATGRACFGRRRFATVPDDPSEAAWLASAYESLSGWSQGLDEA